MSAGTPRKQFFVQSQFEMADTRSLIDHFESCQKVSGNISVVRCVEYQTQNRNRVINVEKCVPVREGFEHDGVLPVIS